ncbi:hypothetical protein CMK18_22050 [Candidatus Poribacteria bacterium]|nr:hypothetical protein [Candidatus Poribacteria bacterium]|tara:strand:- start:159 stop:359 length:201 start_codon:yes stop_codon:yes gene_type:complete
MDFDYAMIAFDVFLLGMLAWFYYYFHTMVSAVLEVNDKLIRQIHGNKVEQEDEMQMKLDNWLSEEE